MRISDWSSDVCSSDLLAQSRPLGAQVVFCAPAGSAGALWSGGNARLRLRSQYGQCVYPDLGVLRRYAKPVSGAGLSGLRLSLSDAPSQAVAEDTDSFSTIVGGLSRGSLALVSRRNISNSRALRTR